MAGTLNPVCWNIALALGHKILAFGANLLLGKIVQWRKNLALGATSLPKASHNGAVAQKSVLLAKTLCLQ